MNRLQHMRFAMAGAAEMTPNAARVGQVWSFGIV